MFDLKDTAVFMYKAAKHRYIYIFTWDGFGEVNVIKIVNEKNFVPYVRTLFTNGTLPYMSHGIIGVINCSLYRL